MPVIVHEYSVYTRNDQHAYIFWMLYRHAHLAFATLTSHWLFFFPPPVSSLYPILIFIVPPSLPLSSLFFLCLLLCILYFNPPIIFLSLHSLRIISIIPLPPPLPSFQLSRLFSFPLATTTTTTSSFERARKETDKTIELISNSLPRQRNRITFIKRLRAVLRAQKQPGGMRIERGGGSPRVDSNRPVEVDEPSNRGLLQEARGSCNCKRRHSPSACGSYFQISTSTRLASDGVQLFWNFRITNTFDTTRNISDSRSISSRRRALRVGGTNL